MAYEIRDNSGSLFTNNRKEKETHPDFNGTAMVDGVVYWISGWSKEGQRGSFTSLAFKRKEDDQRPGDQRPTRGPPAISQRAQATVRKPDPISSGRSLKADMDDDIPFNAEHR